MLLTMCHAEFCIGLDLRELRHAFGADDVRPAKGMWNVSQRQKNWRKGMKLRSISSQKSFVSYRTLGLHHVGARRDEISSSFNDETL